MKYMEKTKLQHFIGQKYILYVSQMPLCESFFPRTKVISFLLSTNLKRIKVWLLRKEFYFCRRRRFTKLCHIFRKYKKGHQQSQKNDNEDVIWKYIVIIKVHIIFFGFNKVLSKTNDHSCQFQGTIFLQILLSLPMCTKQKLGVNSGCCQ